MNKVFTKLFFTISGPLEECKHWNSLKSFEPFMVLYNIDCRYSYVEVQSFNTSTFSGKPSVSSSFDPTDALSGFIYKGSMFNGQGTLSVI